LRIFKKMAESLESLLNREYLRAYLEEQTGQPVTDAELDGFIVLMKNLVRENEVLPDESLCGCRGVFTVLLWIIYLASVGMSIFTCVKIAQGGYDLVSPALIISAASVAIAINCGCLCHMTYLRLNDSDSVFWILELVATMFFIVPQVLMFASVVGAPLQLLLPSSIAIFSILGACFCCFCIVYCCSTKENYTQI